LAPVASIASAGCRMAGSTPVAGFTIRQRSTAQPGSAASVPGRDTWGGPSRR
jgi:hypothetical protein